MRQFLLLSCLMGLFFYSGFALQSPDGALASPGVPVALKNGMAAMGGRPVQVTVMGWGSAGSRLDSAERLFDEDDWTGMHRPSLKLYRSHGTTYAVLTWTGQGAAVAHWERAFLAIERILQMRSGEYQMSVEMEGRTRSVLTPAELLERGLDSLKVSDRQPWTDGVAASGAGRSPFLPPSKLGLNVQIAARRHGSENRLWVSWPMLRREY